MSKTVGAKWLGRERWPRPTRMSNGTTNQAVNAEACQRFIPAVEENEFTGGTCSSEQPELIRSIPPNRADAHLIAFANETHLRRAAPGNIPYRQVGSL